MHFPTSTLILGLFAIGRVISMPTTDNGINILARQDEPDCGDTDAPSRSMMKRAKCKVPVQCGPSDNQAAYGNGKVNTVVGKAKQLVSRNEKQGSYPKLYGANDIPVMNALPDECKAQSGRQLYEFPILPEGYFGGDDATAGQDRVIISDTSGVRSYCLTITHRGATDNSFVPCLETTG